MDVLQGELGQWSLQGGQREGEEHQEPRGAGGQRHEGAEHHQVLASCEGAENMASQMESIPQYLEGGIQYTLVVAGQSPRRC